MKGFIVFVMLIFFFACDQQQRGYEIEVNLEGAEGQILLEKREGSAWIPVDTARITDGVAVLTGEVDYPADYYLSVAGQQEKTMVFVENEQITVSGNADSLGSVQITGSKTHDEYNQVNQQIREIGEEYMTLYQQARSAGAAGDTAKATQLMDKVNELYNRTATLQKEFIESHPSSYATPHFLSRIHHGLELEELEQLINSLDDNLHQVTTIVSLKERIDKLKTVAVGQIAPDFIMNDPEGNPVSFSDIYAQNEYTLLDFWASWCGPCRRENPNVVAVYQEFNEKGFGVFGVSLDRDKESWLNAIEDDQLTWPHVSDLAYWNNAAARLYAVNSIPSSLIVDKDGKIVAKDKRGDALRETVSELLE